MALTPKRLYTRVAERSPILRFPHLLCVIAFVSLDSDQFAARRSVGDCHPHCDQGACHIAKPRDYFAGEHFACWRSASVPVRAMILPIRDL